jgi:hypothetical protein
MTLSLTTSLCVTALAACPAIALSLSKGRRRARDGFLAFSCTLDYHDFTIFGFGGCIASLFSTCLGHSNLPFDLAQGDELIEPFRAWDFVLRHALAWPPADRRMFLVARNVDLAKAYLISGLGQGFGSGYAAL